MPIKDTHMQACIEACLACYQVCQNEVSNHCLEAGGRHVEPNHVRLMLACAAMCRTAAEMMLIGVTQHRLTCAVCAAICDDCAASCAAVGDMDACVAACRACAESCRAMAGGVQVAA